jgi:protein-S-isoprenylcysteine O-methyltransferase Ste14
MGWGIAYAVLLALLLVRFQDPDAPVRTPPRPQPGEPLRLVAAHHLVFYALLLAAPAEAVVLGGAPAGRWLGLAAFAAGVGLYRAAARALGEALSPFVEPVPGSTLARTGPFRLWRHPMYLGQALIALGAPLTLGAWRSLGLSVVALAVLVIRGRREEAALRRTFADYDAYARRTKRVVPRVF